MKISTISSLLLIVLAAATNADSGVGRSNLVPRAFGDVDSIKRSDHGLKREELDHPKRSLRHPKRQHGPSRDEDATLIEKYKASVVEVAPRKEESPRSFPLARAPTPVDGPSPIEKRASVVELEERKDPKESPHSFPQARAPTPVEREPEKNDYVDAEE